MSKERRKGTASNFRFDQRTTRSQKGNGKQWSLSLKYTSSLGRRIKKREIRNQQHSKKTSQICQVEQRARVGSLISVKDLRRELKGRFPIEIQPVSLKF